MNGNGAAALRIRGATDEPPDGRANTGSFQMLPPSSTPESTTPAAAAAAYSLPPPIITQEGQAARRRGRLLDTDGSLVAEDDEGAVEYKWRLTNISATRFEHLKTQMQFRVAEGHGQCLYELGVADNGTPRGLTTGDFDESVDTVRRMAESLGYDLRIIFERVVETTPELLRCVELMVTKKLTACDQTDLRIAFCGETDTGKSTLVSVLVHGTLDDGTGVARQGMFNHKHEVTSGQTSSVSRRVLGFDETGRVTNYDVLEEKSGGGVADVYGGAHLCAAMNTTRTIAERSVKLVTLMDLGGARRYRKTALLSMTSRMPGYACICARIDRVLRDVEQYLILCRALRIPCFVVLTKADTVSELEIDDAVFELQDMIEHRFSLKMLRVEGDDEVSLAISALASSTATSPVRPSTVAVDNNNSAVDNDVSTSASVTPTDDVTDSPSTTPTTFTRIGGQDQQRIVPVFVMSSVEGTGVESLKLLLHGLPIPPPSQPHQLGGAVPSALPVIPSTNSLGSSLSGSKLTAALAASSPTTASAAKRSGSIEVLLDGVLTVPRVGTVVCGFVAKGIVHLHDTLSIGPDRKGQFHSVSVEGIHVKGSHVTYATSGLEVTIAIRHVSTTVPLPSTLSLSRKGNILVD
ncbi:GTP-binding protein, putative, partial [Bodo saltans]